MDTGYRTLSGNYAAAKWTVHCGRGRWTDSKGLPSYCREAVVLIFKVRRLWTGLDILNHFHEFIIFFSAPTREFAYSFVYHHKEHWFPMKYKLRITWSGPDHERRYHYPFLIRKWSVPCRMVWSRPDMTIRTWISQSESDRHLYHVRIKLARPVGHRKFLSFYLIDLFLIKIQFGKNRQILIRNWVVLIPRILSGERIALVSKMDLRKRQCCVG